MTTKYKWAVELSKKIEEFGVEVKIDSPIEKLTGQDISDNSTTYQSYQTSVLFDDTLYGRTDGYQRSDYSRCFMPPIERTPRPGDILSTNKGRKYIIDNVLVYQPDGADLLYDLSLSDG